MPELPEVMRMAESLNRHLSNKRLLNIQINEKSRYYSTNVLKNYSYLTKGLLLQGVISRAKRILFMFYDEINNRNIILTSFLGMEGHWLPYNHKYSGVILTMGQIKKMKNVILNIIEKVFYYDDMRHQGILNVCISSNDIEDVFKNVGPDFIYGGITLQMYYDKIKNKRTLHKEICWWMLEQKYFSGIGNYLKSEILYRCGIAPYRTLGSLTDQEIKLLLYWSIEVIKESYSGYGLTIATYADPDGNLGNYVRRVYKQPYDPNGYPVLREVLTDKRGTYWCPKLQK